MKATRVMRYLTIPISAILFTAAVLAQGNAVALAQSNAVALAQDNTVVEEEWKELMADYLNAAPDLAHYIDNPEDRADRYQLYEYIFSQIATGHRMLMYANTRAPDFYPVFSHINSQLWANPDTTYLVSPIDSDGTYRLSGNRGTAKLIDIQQGAGTFVTQGKIEKMGGGMGSAISSDSIDDFDLSAKGEFDIIYSDVKPKGYKGDWRKLENNATYLLVRQVFYDWESEIGGRFSIDRLDVHPGDAELSEQQFADNLRGVARWAKNWVNVANSIADRVHKRNLLHKFDYVDWSEAGLNSQSYVVSAFDLQEGKALLIETEVPESCLYWNFQLVTEDWRSINPLRYISSINGHQARVDSDGKFRAIVALSDPGVPNWLDPGQHNKARVYGRWNNCNESPLPEARLIDIAKLREHLPADTPAVSPQQREAQIRTRRRHAQMRIRW